MAVTSQAVTSRTADRTAGEGAVVPPRADCVADPAGGLVLDLTGFGDADGAHLVLRHRDGGQEVRLPLAPAADGRPRAVLPGGAELPEGCWDAFAQSAGGTAERLVSGLNDLRSLVDRVPDGADDRIGVRIPYATKHGNLSVRSWLRAPHAEAGELHPGQEALEVRGRVYGAALTPDAYAELAGRAGEEPRRAGVHRDGAEFRFTVVWAGLPQGDRDLWLRPAGEDGPRVRIARLLDDIVDKQSVLVYPKVTLETERGAVTAGPYYTTDNDLAVTVTAADS
ncbi:hypothetical protein [Streptomyces beigongshangae]|uniref:hypothetical protein n=1 Tax=Streptomyces beigongshangae TaxID=2841597 RepID=UPI003D316FEB